MKSLLNHFREPISGLTHLIGALLAVVGMIYLLIEAAEAGKTIHFVAFLIFGLSMILLYTSSALYHILKVSEQMVLKLKKLDHSMIYVLIAGTYTPICLLALDGLWKWGSFVTIWVIAAAGILFKLFWIHAPRWLSTLLYLGMGWISLVIFPQLFGLLPPGFMIWIGIGGAAYTGGAIIYALKKPDPIPEWFGFHEIWHICVMIGTFSHFWAIYDYLPAL